MRTYGSRPRAARSVSDDHKSVSQDQPTTSSGSKRLFRETGSASRTKKRARTLQNGTKSKLPADKFKQKSLTQLHFCIDQSILRRCPLCDLCYTKGATEDVALHKAHCSRAQKGMEWSKEEDREGYGTTIAEINSRVGLNDGKIGRIISFPADIGGKIGNKLSALMQTVNFCLSSPSLAKSALQSSKAYIFLLPQENASKPERIVGCVIAQRIESAMDVILPEVAEQAEGVEDSKTAVDVAGIFCKPDLQPTPMGISRMFVSSSHRRQGIARALLSAAADTFIPGCRLDPLKGQIAFSQPTGDGNKVIQNWGGGHIRIYEED